MCYGRLRHLVSYLPTQPGYHTRIKAAAPLINKTLLYLATRCLSWFDELRLVDGTPIPCGTWPRPVQDRETFGAGRLGETDSAKWSCP
ncbi:hypothetical protein MSHI_25550 [Mycobacterium shinjukuense]|uniref:Transposase n=1 Tax=Mycobacterium shinjukuense TaxID=398694 RepID=A0A7I7MTU1_9MYCO|nr:hypothetical protein MSHI_25550 [Mycobacterium shinjukuense]